MWRYFLVKGHQRNYHWSRIKLHQGQSFVEFLLGQKTLRRVMALNFCSMSTRTKSGRYKKAAQNLASPVLYMT